MLAKKPKKADHETEKVDVVFFDLDDTLIETSHRHFHVYRDILGSNKIPNVLLEKEFWEQKRNGVQTAKLCPPEFQETFMTEWLMKIEEREYLKYDALYPETLAVLSALKGKIDLVLVTLRKDKSNLLWQLDELGLTDYFSEILVGSPSSKNKVPLVKEYLKNNPQKNSCVIVGDSEVDVQLGKELGFLVVAFANGLRTKSFLSKLQPDFFIENLSEFLLLFNVNRC